MRNPPTNPEAPEYDPFGRTVVSTWPLANANPFRFSTKHWDDATGLGYWCYRWYDAEMGRWRSRDPLGTIAGILDLAFCYNTPYTWVDPVGLATLPVSNSSQAKKPCCSNPAVDKEGYAKSLAAVEKTRTDGKHREFCGLICCNKKTNNIRGTPPHGGPLPKRVEHVYNEFTGEMTDVIIGASCEPHVAYDHVRGTDVYTRREVKCNDDEIEVASYHSHPGKDFPFSVADWGFVNTVQHSLYLGVPGDKVYRLDPDPAYIPNSEMPMPKEPSTPNWGTPIPPPAEPIPAQPQPSKTTK